jgi:hypothetical protein
MMLGYTKKDLDDMLTAIWSAKSMVDFNNDPWLHDHLQITGDFLNGLWAEGYFD